LVYYKQIVSFDEDCLVILKEQPEKKKSDYIRKAVKFYTNNKDKKFMELPKKPQKVVMEL